MTPTTDAVAAVAAASPPSSTDSRPPPQKRRRKTTTVNEDNLSPTALGLVSPVSTMTATSSTASSSTSSSSSFRNVSACNRCRLRKNRCDQRLPACLSCEKAQVRCVGFDPVGKREIPRSYVYYLETRVAHLENLLSTNNIPYPAPEDFSDIQLPNVAHTSAPAAPPPPPSQPTPTLTTDADTPPQPQPPIDPALQSTSAIPSPRIKQESPPRSDLLEGKRLENLVSDIGLVSFQGASDPRYLGSVSGISFARVVFAAVKSSASNSSAKDDAAGGRDGKRGFRGRIGSTTRVRGSRGLGIGGRAMREHAAAAAAGSGGAGAGTGEGEEQPQSKEAEDQMRDSFFGLHTKPTIAPAPFPGRGTAERLVDLYFEHANPQIPSLHRFEFRKVLETIYGPVECLPNAGLKGAPDYDVDGKGLGGTARERYLLNIVCAIGAGIFLTGPDEPPTPDDETAPDDAPRKKQKLDAQQAKGKQYEPESYHAAAMLHLESFLSQSKGGLEELQAVLLLAGYALLRPVSPGLWYIVGVALRLAVDLGLHYEDAETEAKVRIVGVKSEKDAKREWTRDMRRRLWWCVYTLDRLVSTCVGRPFGISDEVISTQFPSLLDDKYISPVTGITPPPPGENPPSYKLIANHYLRLRLLQSEILSVLQQQSHTFSFASATSENDYKRDHYKGKENYPLHHPYHLQTPYLHKHASLVAWHNDVDRRLTEWMESAPKHSSQTGVQFSPLFLELNYWQAKIMLYRPCLSVPVLLAGDLGSNSGSQRSRAAEKGFGGGAEVLRSQRADEEDRVYLVVAEAGGKVLRIYRQLHRVHQVNYTFLATHHLFMAGISFLYAIWHSPLVRSKLSMDEVDFTILAATSVLGDLIGKCPPAEACRDSFARMSKAVVSMCLSQKAGPVSKILPAGSTTMVPQDRMQIDTDELHLFHRRQRNAGAFSVQQQQHQRKQHHHQRSRSQYHSTPPPPPPPPHPQPQQQPQHSLLSPHHIPQTEVYSSSERSTQNPSSLQQSQQRQPIHFDDGFRELFTSPRLSPPTSSPSNPTNPTTSTSRDLYRFPHSPTTGTEPPHHFRSNSSSQPPQQQQQLYPQSLLLDPSLSPVSESASQQPQQQLIPLPSDWASLDLMTQFGIPGFGDVASSGSNGGGNGGGSGGLAGMGGEWGELDGWSDEGGGSGGQGLGGGVDLFDGFFFGGVGGGV
ncbi:hypothetical protein EX30DRAFT_360191 [Ascodesmis nigricans]|uniref:Zn(2)-C6 fungal-type domain-containing protein n=1 Tax=Ascodesmis nigricans TaxID=341454 RepID=A0A4S2MK05_9PEZI|nr:hypothetical protein EX30DRAFT_360191 [Ascodesmis nigricans]